MKLARVLLHFRDNIWASECTTTPPLGHWVQSAGIGSKRFFAENAFFFVQRILFTPSSICSVVHIPWFQIGRMWGEDSAGWQLVSQPTKVPSANMCKWTMITIWPRLNILPKSFLGRAPLSGSQSTQRGPQGQGKGPTIYLNQVGKNIFGIFFWYHQPYLLENKNTILETISYSFMWPLEAHIKVFIICITLVMKTYLVKFIWTSNIKTSKQATNVQCTLYIPICAQFPTMH